MLIYDSIRNSMLINGSKSWILTESLKHKIIACIKESAEEDRFDELITRMNTDRKKRDRPRNIWNK